jgi:hypothetical protein
LLQTFFAIVGDINFIVVLTKEPGKYQADVLVVVNDQYWEHNESILGDTIQGCC